MALNVTGGNKLMALAAQAVAQAAGWPAFYVDVDTDQIIWLDKTRPAQTNQPNQPTNKQPNQTNQPNPNQPKPTY